MKIFGLNIPLIGRFWKASAPRSEPASAGRHDTSAPPTSSGKIQCRAGGKAHPGSRSLAQGVVPAIVPFDSKPWAAMGRSRSSFFKLDTIERQCIALDQILDAGATTEIEQIRRKLEVVRTQRSYCDVAWLPVDLLLDAVTKRLPEPVPPPQQPPPRRSWAKEIKDFLRHSPHTVMASGELTVHVSTRGLAKQLGCVASTVHSVLHDLQVRGFVRLEAGPRGTVVHLLRNFEQPQVWTPKD